MLWKFSLIFAFISFLTAEEGMWPFNQIPVQKIEQDYGVKLDPAWIEHVQKSCLRVSLGGSASLISPRGLFITNQHVGARAIYNLSSEKEDLMENGFLAVTEEEEIPCPNMYVDQLISIRDVTEEIQRSAQNFPLAERENQRKIAMAKIKEQAQKETGLHPEIIPLYQGARYHLYLYQRYSDIRLVMAPEKGIGFFGGDTDNFEYPRYSLDICFFRIYQDGKPLASPYYLKWSSQGPQNNEPLFVAGHPGKTNRRLTASHLQFMKETDVSLTYEWLKELISHFHRFSNISPENKRIALEDLHSFENRFKVFHILHKELFDTSLIKDKANKEKALFKTVDPTPWKNLESALAQAKTYYPSYLVLENANFSKLYQWARQFVRLSHEIKLPNEERLKEYIDTELPTLEQNLLSTEPTYLDLEKLQLQLGFQRMEKILGKEHPVTQILRASNIDSLLSSTQLHQLSYRQHLYEHLDEVEKSTDPFILLAQAIDPYARKVRSQKEQQLDSVQNETYTSIAKIFFEKQGDSLYPDATFTLRLSIGTMKGYNEKGHLIPPMTYFKGLYERARDHKLTSPYDLPPKWLSRESALNKAAPFNFVSTNDIVGGNSGSPVVNAKGEFVGIIFDGNRESIAWNLIYDSTKARAVSVHPSGIIEALKKIYGADSLIAEILP